MRHRIPLYLATALSAGGAAFAQTEPGDTFAGRFHPSMARPTKELYYMEALVLTNWAAVKNFTL